VIPTSLIVPGDVVSLAAGNQVPADCRILECKDLFVDQSALTGESFPASKEDVSVDIKASLGDRENSLFFGSHVVSGSATVVVVATGSDTAFGELAASVSHTPPPTEFELGVRHFGYLLLEVAGALSLVAFAVNIGYDRPALDVLLFTLALVVGMTPQLLPAIVTSTLAQGAHRLARGNAIVRRLGAIADIGGVTILCTDKTGTLTEGVVSLHSALGWDGAENEKTKLCGYLNAVFQSGYANLLDDAIKAQPLAGAEAYTKLDEVPYDFIRKRLGVLVRHGDIGVHIVKGAFNEVLSICSYFEGPEERLESIEPKREAIRESFERLSKEGYRTLSVAYRLHAIDTPVDYEDEREMVFLGFLCFIDPPKQSALQSVRDLERNGIQVKMVTGDNRFVAANVARVLGVLSPEALITGAEIDELNDRALQRRALEIDVFAEVDPNQKGRIIRALKNAKVGVAYLGDGINDASALRAADVGISVDTAVESTKEAADIVLVTKDLNILLRAVREGRRAFGNTLKYILLSTSANFGNMFSVVGASFFADFLPMLPKQILLLNVLSDLPAMGLATDRVDEEMMTRPLKWNIGSLSRSMIAYGVVSSVFDYITFGSLLILGVSADVFRTGWFIESVLTEVLVLYVIRTRRPLLRSQAGTLLVSMSLLVSVLAILLPYSPLASPLGFTTLPLRYGLIVAIILVLYVSSSEIVKRYVNR
jgi:Mg2+-importing ATPase